MICLLLGLSTGAAFMAMLMGAIQKHQEKQAVCEQLADWNDRQFSYCKENRE
jgi:hypothetical protein